MNRRMVLYRGSLKSCNYHCSYCPFSKHRMSECELEKDKEQWDSFVSAYVNDVKWAAKIRAVMVAPYGEAMIHPWYWEGLAQISALSRTDAVGAQTNLSFSVQQSLELFVKAGGIPEKLRIWATFHPQMVSVEEFAMRCRQLKEAGVVLCAGAVGVPKYQNTLMRLRKELPNEIYLWINRMDGLGREYTPEEKQVFFSIDPYFHRELLPHTADAAQCQGRLFIEGDGRVRMCNIGRPIGRLAVPSQCSRKRCSCYLAYGGRDELMNHVLFGPYPLFRIPRRARAVFLDIEGTLLSADPDSVEAGLQALVRERIPFFFATTMPHEDAIKRCHGIVPFFRGGIFAAGAHLRMEEADGAKEYFAFLDEACIPYLELLKGKYHFRILDYRHHNQCYKLTLFRASRMPWAAGEAEMLFQCLPNIIRKKLRYFVEENCMQIVASGIDKASGVRLICEWLGIQPQEAFAAGDSPEDMGMLEITLCDV